MKITVIIDGIHYDAVELKPDEVRGQCIFYGIRWYKLVQTFPFIGAKVLWKNIQCIVTNPFVAAGKKCQISPVGNGDSPAKYYTVLPEELKLML